MEKLTLASKYKNNKIPLDIALKSNMNDYLISMVKKIVFHNLSDVDPLFKEVLGVNIDYKKNDKVLRCIEIRHDIVHRNGFSKNGNKIDINASEIEECVDLFAKVLMGVDQKIAEKYL